MFEHNLAWYSDPDADPQQPATHYCNGNFDHGSSGVVLGSLFMRHLRITFEVCVCVCVCVCVYVCVCLRRLTNC